MTDQRRALARMRRGQLAAARRQRELTAREGARPERAVAESRSAANALEQIAGWPAQRDPVAARGIEIVRRRWAKLQKRAKRARQG